MAVFPILAGSTSQSIDVTLWVQATGAPQTGLVFNSSGLTAAYSFTGAVAGSVSITLATLATTTTAYSSGGFIELDATKQPGVYRLDLPNAALATSKGRQVVITLTGFSGMATTHHTINLMGWDDQAAQVPANATQFAGQTITAGAGVTIPASLASPTNITAGTITTVTNLTNAATSGDLTATMKASVATAALTTQMTESYAADGTAPTLAQAVFETKQALTEFSISGTTITAKKLDGSTTAATYTLDSSTTPTSRTRAS